MVHSPESRSLPDRIVRWSAAASLAASALLHGYIEYTPEHEGHGPRVEMAGFNPFAKEITDSHIVARTPVGEPYIEERTTGEGSKPTTATEEQRTTLESVKAPYAREFAADPVAREFSREDADRLLKTASNLKAEGWDTVTIEVRGSSSAEDDANDGTAGLQTPSEQNQKLADTRRDAVINTIREAQAAKQQLADIAVIPAEGREGSLKDNQVRIIASFAEQFGYADAGSLVEAYNDNPNQVPEIVKDLLDILLDSERGTIQTIVATRTVPGTEGSGPKTEEVCMIPVETTTETTTYHESSEILLPYGVMIVLGGGFAGIILAAGAEFARLRKDFPRVSAPHRSAGGGGGGGLTPEDDEPSTPVQKREPIQEVPVEPGEEPEAPEKKKRRILPWILAPIAVIGAGVVIKSCSDDTPRKPTPVVKPADPCEGLPREEVVVSNRNHRVYGGVIPASK